MNRVGQLKHKEVINVCDGTRLGFVCDVEINLYDGRIEGIVIPCSNKFFGILGKENEYIIPWDNIVKIGEDIILVEMNERTMRKFLEY